MNPENILGSLGGPLNDVMKRLEKHLIKNYVAKQIEDKAHVNRTKVKRSKKTVEQQLIQQSNQFESEFSSTTKGKWVDSAMLSFSKSKDRLKDI